MRRPLHRIVAATAVVAASASAWLAPPGGARVLAQDTDPYRARPGTELLRAPPPAVDSPPPPAVDSPAPPPAMDSPPPPAMDSPPPPAADSPPPRRQAPAAPGDGRPVALVLGAPTSPDVALAGAVADGMARAAIAVGYRAVEASSVPGLAAAARWTAAPTPATLWRLADAASAHVAIVATVARRGARVLLRVLVASRDGRGPFQTAGAAPGGEVAPAVVRLVVRVLPGPGDAVVVETLVAGYAGSPPPLRVSAGAPLAPPAAPPLEREPSGGGVLLGIGIPLGILGVLTGAVALGSDDSDRAAAPVVLGLAMLGGGIAMAAAGTHRNAVRNAWRRRHRQTFSVGVGLGPAPGGLAVYGNLRL